MPQVTTYIRKDDLGLWLALPNKSKAIHNMLHQLKPTALPKIINTPEDAKKVLVPNANGFDKGKAAMVKPVSVTYSRPINVA